MLFFFKALGDSFALFVPTASARAGRFITAAFVAGVLFCASAPAQNGHEGKRISEVVVAFEGDDRNVSISEQFRQLARDAVGPTYSAVKLRDAIDQLYSTRRISSVTVEAFNATPDSVALRFVIKRKTQAQKVSVQLVDVEGDESGVTEQEILFRLTLLEPGAVVTEQTLRSNTDLILEYLRERGYFKADVTFTQQPISNANEVAVVFRIDLNEPALVRSFTVDIEGMDGKRFVDEVRLKPGERFTRDLLRQDEEKIRELLREEGFLAPTLSEARPEYDPEANRIDISVTGTRGPNVEVEVEAERDRPGSRTQNRLLPIKREGTLDYSAIIEGERRLETHYQEIGYFFANVTAYCSVEPPLDTAAGAPQNDTVFLCASLTNSDLTNRKVTVTYRVALSRQLKLTDIRLTGTDQFTIDEIKPALESQEANIFGIIPLFGYGRGYTSQKLLDEDAATIESLLRGLGYQQATVRVDQGVSLDGENLVITFVVDQGDPTIVSDVRIVGNKDFTEAVLMQQLPPLVGKNFSRARLRNGQRKLQEFLAQAGYFDAVVDSGIGTRTVDPATGGPLFQVIYEIKHRANPLAGDLVSAPGERLTVPGEGEKVYIGRVLITGNDKTKTSAIERALTLKPGHVLRGNDIYTSEQNLYSSDAFSRVEIKERPVGETPQGRETDLIVSVEEQAPRILSYGGGISTDVGASGFVDIRHQNLFGRLWQGGARVRMSQRQQLAQIDFLNPRFLRDGENRFAPLTLSAQYRRDSTVTRFFRSAFDRGTFGIVQRVDEEGNPIDEFGNDVGDPTLNSIRFTAETNRTISLKDRSILFFRYRFEDVRLYNIQSLLIRELLEPDRRIRISGFGATYVRDTRQNCNIKYTILDIIERGEPGEPCRYSASDPTKGSYLTAEFNSSIPALGANIGFNKFQASYNVYFSPKGLRNTTFAGRAILGLAHVYSSGDRFANSQIPDLEGILPISERFFAGGSTTLRGFDFESAGPRVVIVPTGEFRRSNGDPVFLDPFTIPFGGNALAVVNLEARFPLTDSIRAVTFYDGGNVFRRVGDIFNPPDVPPGDVARHNLRALWSHTVGVGLRLKTPFGGEFGVDYGYLLNPPTFLIPQMNGPNANYRLAPGHIHFRFSQAF